MWVPCAGWHRPKIRCRMRSKPCAKPKRSSPAAPDGRFASCYMTWNVVLSNRAERALGRVPARDRQRITQALLSMEQEPLSGDVVPLKGPYEGSYGRPRWLVADHFRSEMGCPSGLCSRCRPANLNDLLT